MQTASNIREHMEVLSSDGKHVGTVDRVEGERIKLTKSDPASGDQHHFIGLDAVESIEDGKVCLNTTEQETRDMWQ
jgi:hypothetical protein